MNPAVPLLQAGLSVMPSAGRLLLVAACLALVVAAFVVAGGGVVAQNPPDDHGNDAANATAVTIGKDVAGNI